MSLTFYLHKLQPQWIKVMGMREEHSVWSETSLGPNLVLPLVVGLTFWKLQSHPLEAGNNSSPLFWCLNELTNVQSWFMSVFFISSISGPSPNPLPVYWAPLFNISNNFLFFYLKAEQVIKKHSKSISWIEGFFSFFSCLRIFKFVSIVTIINSTLVNEASFQK